MPIGIGEAKGTAYVETSHLGYLRVKSGSATPERRIVRRIFRLVAASCLLATAGLIPISVLADDDLIANQLGAYLEPEAGHLSGVLLVAKGNQILFQGAYGKASIAFDRNNEIDTKFNVASVGKMFTGVAIVQLAERGLISYSDPIAKYLPRICLLIQPTISHCLATIRFNFLLEVSFPTVAPDTTNNDGDRNTVATLNNGIRKIITGQNP
jgi:CubicO group peptidase (beta-lactamase class C family)